MYQFSSVQSLSPVWLFATPWITACQASLSITNSRRSPKLTSIKLVMPSSHLILCRTLLFLPLIPPSITVFSSESTLCMRWPKYWSFSFNISPSNEHTGLTSFRMDWLDLYRYYIYISNDVYLSQEVAFFLELKKKESSSRQLIFHQKNPIPGCQTGTLLEAGSMFFLSFSCETLSHIGGPEQAWSSGCSFRMGPTGVPTFLNVPGAIMEILPMTRSWRKYLTGKTVQDPIHDEVMRKNPDRQGRPGYKTSSRLALASTPPCILSTFLLLFLFPCCGFLCCLLRALLLLFHWIKTNLKP